MSRLLHFWLQVLGKGSEILYPPPLRLTPSSMFTPFKNYSFHLLVVFEIKLSSFYVLPFASLVAWLEDSFLFKDVFTQAMQFVSIIVSRNMCIHMIIKNHKEHKS